MPISLAQRAVIQAVKIQAVKIQRPTFFGVLACALLLLVLIQAVRLFWAISTPVAPVGDWQPKAPALISQSEQKALFASIDPFFRQQVDEGDSEKITSLPLSLFGIRGNEVTGAGSAIIADSEGMQLSYLTGEEIMLGVTLHAVAFDHVVLSNNGSLEKLFLDQSVPAETVGGDTAEQTPSDNRASDASDGSAQLNPQTLAASISLTPRNENGGVTGLVVAAKDDGKMLQAAGLRAGDIITKINDQPASSANDLAAQIRPGARLSLEIERGGQVVPVAIILENP